MNQNSVGAFIDNIILNNTSMSQKSQASTKSSEKRISQWEALMRKFSEAHKEECKTESLDIPRALRSTKQFPTGSQYKGTWDVLGMSGYGTYTFPNGVIYEGEFDDGMFHGEGEMRYPSGAIIRGKWQEGTMIERALFFADDLEYAETDWPYCKNPDRRFAIEHTNGLQPAGASYLTADQPTREIPPGFYDTSDGFYDPKTKVVYKADDMTAIIRAPSPLEQKWIIANCRTNPDVPVGPRPELYEEWTEPVPTVPSTPASRPGSFAGSYTLEYKDAKEDEDSMNYQRSAATARWSSRPFIQYNPSYAKRSTASTVKFRRTM